MIVMNKILTSVLLAVLVSACVSTNESVYAQLGGEAKVQQIVENFVTHIEQDQQILAYFEGADIDRFIAKFSEQICARTGGPCSYTGDSMGQVHAGMNITEGHFNRTVDLLINAMNDADVPHPLQNKVLNVLAPTRKDIVYQ